MIAFLFILGFILLIKGADWLVDGSVSIAKKFQIPSIVIGLTIVAFGTSAPEFAVNMVASLRGNTDIAIGNILGSNIANILLILGLSAAISPVVAKKNTVLKEIPFSLLAASLVAVLGNDMRIDGGVVSVLTRIDGLVLLSFFVIFFYYIFGIANVPEETQDAPNVKAQSVLTSLTYIVGGLVALIIGGRWIVNGAVEFAQVLGVSQAFIGLTIVAVGTSLPEMATSLVAAYKKQSDIAIGNIVGSNIFNIFWILGVSAVIRPLPLQTSSDLDLVMTMVASMVLFSAMYIGKKHVLERWQGVLMVCLYVGYVTFLIMQQ